VKKQQKQNGEMLLDLEIVYAPTELEPHPLMVDLRIKASSNATFINVLEGEALIASNKSVSTDPKTGNPWFELDENVFRIVIFSSSNLDTIGDGVLLKIQLVASVNETDYATLNIIRRDDIFAPPSADSALQISNYDQPIVISKW